jgi:CheY-like chemotaxis protein
VTLRCLIVDDSPRFLDAVRGLLEHEGIAVVGVASTSAEALRRTEELRPDVTLLDIDLGGESGLELARRLHREAGPAPPRVILISTYAEQDFAELIAASPAVGFLPKSDLSAGASATCSQVMATPIPAAMTAGLQEGDYRLRNLLPL